MTINNNNIFGVFTLGEVRSGRLTGEWLNKESVANYGWFGGGANYPSRVSTVDRIDFSNDTGTANIRGPLSSVRYAMGATGNSNYGWFGGGIIPGPAVASTVDRIDFSNDSSTASVRGSLSLARRDLAATGNSNYGWFGGGIIPGPAVVATVDRIDFSNDSATASVRGPLIVERLRLAATGNSNYGWFGGGSPGPVPVSRVDRIDFSNDSSTASPRGPLSLARFAVEATGNSNYGWFGGGIIPGPAVVATVDRIDFSNDSTTASVRGPLTSVRYNSSATGNSNYGWFGGGATPTKVATVDRIDFSNDSVTASPRGPLSSARYNIGATSGVLNIRRQKAGNYGWIGDNQYYVPPFTSVSFSTVDRINFSNDSVTASVRGPLSLARYNSSATGNSNYGWFGGGFTTGGSPGPLSTVDRIDFSNDSSTASVRGPLSLARSGVRATGNSNYGWFGGGFPAVSTVDVDRIDFSNDSSTASVRGNMAIGTNQFGATGNSNYGWFGGGQSPGPSNIGYSYVQRIDFSNDSPIASVRGPLSASGYLISATGNSNYGWFGNRTRNGGSTAITTIDRIDFSNDSVTSSPRGTTNTGRKYASATGNSNFGWWFGGAVSPGSLSAYSSVERINFSNDLATASLRGNLSAIRSNSAATSNTSR
jgi:hypothetical protein